ncbi:glycosyltransferase family 2 protein [Marilutibacter aestuarii]|uniref:Glycosyltransferase family 2 protein n=1 Tax=Marilutibacter aestuarii TaxID=1706195 RepID=A0A508A263_9GAMM|nr:glycosyltransferase family 2 protein [Lysobacter aestuarii]TQD43949.1 glycosyltransferase family 2 protein [Lysobacter aestuarii]
MNAPHIAVVVPCYRVGDALLPLLERIGPEVGSIHVVDDACPHGSGAKVRAATRDPRVRVYAHDRNLGVGAAVLTGYRAALDAGADIVVKLDGDGQMDPALVPALTRPIRDGRADYCKGNRFHRLGDLRGMPPVRLLGNACLSFMTKASSGYWQLFDPTNGFTAIHALVLAQLDTDRLARRYFFESDLLHHLNALRAVVVEMPMPARYGEEVSSLRPMRMVWPFLGGNLRNFLRRIGHSYFLRGFSIASVELLLAVPLLGFGLAFGAWQWLASIHDGELASAGTVMLAALPLILGAQLLLSWLNFDVAAEPRQPIHPMLPGPRHG